MSNKGDESFLLYWDTSVSGHARKATTATSRASGETAEIGGIPRFPLLPSSRSPGQQGSRALMLMKSPRSTRAAIWGTSRRREVSNASAFDARRDLGGIALDAGGKVGGVLSPV